MPEIRVIALDLDGTLLNSGKALTPENAAALYDAAAAGIEIVPTTGRFFRGMPEAVRALPFLHYAITVNGAQVYDIRRDAGIAAAEIPMEQAIEIMSYLDGLPVIYDCFMDNWGWMTRRLQEAAADFVPDPHYQKMVRELRSPVPELKRFLRETGHDVQKVQLFTRDLPLRERLLRDLEGMFGEIAVSTSMPNNIEINNIHANKGEALEKLAAHLGLELSRTMAVGDGLNDLSMIRRAGLGVAMANACPEVLRAADVITGSCDDNGVAAAIRNCCL